MTDRRSADALDAELVLRVDAGGRMAVALVELENHPGHRLLSTAALTGETATRWASTREILAGLWEDFGVYQAVVAAACTIRDRRPRPGDPKLTELHHLLREASVEVSRTVSSPPEHRLTGTADQVETITLDQLSARMDAAFGQVSDVVLTCDAVRQAFLLGLPPLGERIRAARELVEHPCPDGADPATESVGRLAARIDELGHTCVTDPLSLAGRPAADVLAALDADLVTATAQLAEVAAVRDSWDDQLAELAASLDEIDTLRGQEEQARQCAQESIADTHLAAPPDQVPILRSRLAALRRPAGWSARAGALSRLRTAVSNAAGEMRAAHERAAGLLDRHTELCGRFEAYRAKAIRLGHAEHPEMLALDDSLRQLLWIRPYDLATATRTLAAYQRRVQAANGHGTGRSA